MAQPALPTAAGGIENPDGERGEKPLWINRTGEREREKQALCQCLLVNIAFTFMNVEILLITRQPPCC